MRKLPLLGAAVMGVLAFPAVASAHTAQATVNCSAIKANYTSFAANSGGKTNTVHYKVALDGVTIKDDFFVLNSQGGREGTLTLPSDPADGSKHTVGFYTAWGSTAPTQTGAGHSSEPLVAPMAPATIPCGSPPPPPVPQPSP